MRRLSATLLALALAVGVASADTTREAKLAAFRAWAEKLMRLEKRVAETRPRRRDLPVRSNNITDDEVTEIQRVASEVWPGAIVNIATVVVGCPCEDGPSCTDQVWVVGHRPIEMKGLLLSRIDGSWAIGPVQLWWLEYERFQSRRAEFPTEIAYWNAKDEFIETFPTCSALAPAANGKNLGIRQ